MAQERVSPGKLTRSETNKKIGGVAGGMAAYFDVDATLVRALWVVAALMGWGLIAYVVLWIMLPQGPGSPRGAGTAEQRDDAGQQ